jgi:predicted O-linked N-acetylglucosamine transferase (SPINDLY family)
VFVEIARRIPSAQFLFLAFNSALEQAFSRRLEAAFAEAGLAARDRIVFLPGVDTVDYWAINMTSDVFLDSLDWSGGNTSLEAVACGLPIVTVPGRFMRGRHSYAILTQLEVKETIASDKRLYIEIAVRLGIDREWRSHVVRRMSDGEHRLYSDMRPVRALERFIDAAVCRGSSCARPA